MNKRFKKRLFKQAWTALTFGLTAFLIFSPVHQTGLFINVANAARIVESVTLDGGTAWTTSVDGDPVTVAPGESIEVAFTIEGTETSNWKCNEWDVGGLTSGEDNFEPDHTANPFGTETETFTVTAPNTDGTYDLVVRARSTDGCNGGSNSITLTDAITVVTVPVCGDGLIQEANNEQCDDGNTENGDGCNSSCEVESNWSCEGEPSQCSIVNPELDNSCGLDIALEIGRAHV